jgi:hypothetical protein
MNTTTKHRIVRRTSLRHKRSAKVRRSANTVAAARERHRILDTAKIPVLSLVYARPNHPWTSIEITEECDRLEVNMTRQAIYGAIRQLVDTGFLTKTGNDLTPEDLRAALAHFRDISTPLPKPLDTPTYQLSPKGRVMGRIVSSMSRGRGILGSKLYPVKRVPKSARKELHEYYADLVNIREPAGVA